MPYKVIWHPKAKDDVAQFEKETRRRILSKIDSIIEDPPHFVERLKGLELFKLRIGNYRAILELDQKQTFIKVFLVADRAKVYKELQRRLK